jgi:hypothetical protein
LSLENRQVESGLIMDQMKSKVSGPSTSLRSSIVAVMHVMTEALLSLKHNRVVNRVRKEVGFSALTSAFKRYEKQRNRTLQMNFIPMWSKFLNSERVCSLHRLLYLSRLKVSDERDPR